MSEEKAAARVQKTWRKKRREITVERVGCFYEMECESTNSFWEELGMRYCKRLRRYTFMSSKGDEVREEARKRGYNLRFVVKMKGKRFFGVACQKTLKPIVFDEGKVVRRSAAKPLS
jgi:hypothetical protein